MTRNEERYYADIHRAAIALERIQDRLTDINFTLKAIYSSQVNNTSQVDDGEEPISDAWKEALDILCKEAENGKSEET